MNRSVSNITHTFALGLAAFVANAADTRSNTLSLAGTWRFQLDRDDVGLKERWFERELPQHIELPGALQNQGFGDDVSVETKWTANVSDRSWYSSPKFEKYRRPGNVKVPFWLQPAKRYVGAAWYQHGIEIPAAWRGCRVVLTLERPHWETRVWLDGKFVGTNNSLSTPHLYDFGTSIAPGRHTLTIRADNHLIVDVGVWAYSMSDHTQGNWNGVVGRRRSHLRRLSVLDLHQGHGGSPLPSYCHEDPVAFPHPPPHDTQCRFHRVCRGGHRIIPAILRGHSGLEAHPQPAWRLV